MMRTFIAIPVFNGASFIERTLRSCVNQSIEAKIVVVNNCSTDGTEAIVLKYKEQYPNIHYFLNSTNLGRVGNWNKCLDLFKDSKCLYLRFLFAGDELLPDAIKKVEEVFFRYPEISSVAHPYEFVSLDNHKSVSSHLKLANKLVSKDEVTRLNFSEGGILGAIVCNVYSRSAIKNIRFDEGLIGKTEFDLTVMLSREMFYLGDTLSRFNLDSHRTFQASLCSFLGLEAAFSEMRVLYKNKNSLNEKIFERYEQEILKNFWIYTFKYMKKRTVVWYFKKSFVEILRRISKKISFSSITF